MKKELQTNQKIETGLIIRKESLFETIKRKITSFFFRQEGRFNQFLENFKNVKPKEEIVIPKEIYQERTKEIQQKYKKGEIEEQEIKQEDKQRLIQLYQKQNQDLKSQILWYRDKIRVIQNYQTQKKEENEDNM